MVSRYPALRRRLRWSAVLGFALLSAAILSLGHGLTVNVEGTAQAAQPPVAIYYSSG